ncbi:MAG: hypothetical protein R3F11_26445 [Verrucomicrobiales bacterium]
MSRTRPWAYGLSFNGGDQSNRIPLILRVPGQEDKSAPTDHRARTIDLLPHALLAAGSRCRPAFRGHRPFTGVGRRRAGPDRVLWRDELLIPSAEIPARALYIPPMDKTVFVDESFEAFRPQRQIPSRRYARRPKERAQTASTGSSHPGHYPIYRLYDLHALTRIARATSRMPTRCLRRDKAARRLGGEAVRRRGFLRFFRTASHGKKRPLIAAGVPRRGRAFQWAILALIAAILGSALIAGWSRARSGIPPVWENHAPTHPPETAPEKSSAP